MKKLLFIVFCFFNIAAFAQNIEFGTGASFTKFKGEVFSDQYNQSFPVMEPVQLSFNAVASGNVPLKYLKDEVVLGVNPNVALSLFYSTIAIDVPVFATLKLGAGSSDQSDSDLGIGIGVGGQFSFFSTYLNSSFAPINYTGVMFLPTLMGEASITFSNYNMYQLRVEFTPVAARKMNENFVGEISQLSIRLIRAFM